ncbi:MAG: DUF2059 domain-containing protein [bacterium]|nr:DUF2059 domain-containing protein [bacterium]
MKKVIAGLILAVLLSFNQNLMASEETHRKTTEELIKVLKVEEMENQGFEQLKQMFMDQTDQMLMSLQDDAKINAAKEKYIGILNKELTWTNLKSKYMELYMELFTEEEMKGIMAFYKSPAGQKFMEKTPDLMDRSMQIGEKTVSEIMLRIGSDDNEKGGKDQQKNEMPKDKMHMQRNK